MADNTELASASGGDTIRTEDRTTYKTPVSLIDVGGVSAEALIGDAGNFMPIEGAAAHDAASAGNPILLGAEFDDTATDSVDEGDVGTLRIAANRNLYVGIRDDAGNERGLNVDASGDIGVTNADLTTIAGAVSGTEMQVDVVAALPAGDNNIGNVDIVTVPADPFGVNADAASTTGSISAKLRQLATDINTALSGSELQVDVVGALPAGTNAIGKLAANDGVDIGDVDVTSLVPGTGATNLGKAEDAVHTTGDVGVMSLSVRTNTATARAGADGDYQPLITDTNGRLHCKLPNNEPINVAQINGVNVTMGNGTSGTGVQRVTIASDSTGQMSVTGAALTALQLIDDPVFTDDDAFTADTSKVMVAGAVRDDEVGSTAVVGADGDVGPLRMDKLGNLKTTQIHDATSEIKYAVIDNATSGDNTLVAAAGAGIKIRVLSLFMIAAGAVNARFESGAGGTALTGQMNLTTNSGFALPYNPGGWFETADNALLNLELSAAVSVDGCLSYVEV